AHSLQSVIHSEVVVVVVVVADDPPWVVVPVPPSCARAVATKTGTVTRLAIIRCQMLVSISSPWNVAGGEPWVPHLHYGSGCQLPTPPVSRVGGAPVPW